MITFDLTQPQTSNAYTAFVTNIIANQNAAAMMYDSNQVSLTAGLLPNMKRYNSTSGLFEQYNGSAWGPLPTNYAVLNANNTFSSANCPIVINSTNSTNTKILFQDAGVSRGFIGAASGQSFYAINGANTIYTFQIDQSGNGYFGAACAATTFNATSNVGLTVTAAASDCAIRLNNTTATTGTNWLITSQSSGSLDFWNATLGTSPLYIDKNGNGTFGAGITASNGAININTTGTQTLQTHQVAGVVKFHLSSWGSGSNFGFLNPAGNPLFNIDVAGNGVFAGAAIAGSGGLRTQSISSAAIGVVSATTALQMWQDGTNYYGVGTNAAGGLDIMANQAGQPIRMYAGTANASPTLSATFTSTGLAVAGTVSGGTVAQTSDEDKKHKWVVPSSANVVSELASVGLYGDFDWKTGGTSLGAGAQTFRKLPSFKSAIHGDDETGLTMNYGGAAMVGVIALSKEMEALRSRVHELEAA